MRSNYIHKKGFTLIELMIVVAIIAILAAIAIPAFTYFISNAKKSDGRDKLYDLGQGAVMYYNENHSANNDGLHRKNKYYPIATAQTGEIPFSTKQIPNPALTGSPWSELHFSISSPIYYQFMYASTTGETFSGCARAHLESPAGFDSTFTLGGREDGTLFPMLENAITDACVYPSLAEDNDDDDQD